MNKELFRRGGDRQSRPLFCKWDGMWTCPAGADVLSSDSFSSRGLILLLWPCLCSRWSCWKPSSITMRPTSYTPLSMVRLSATDRHGQRLNSALSAGFVVRSFNKLSLSSVLALVEFTLRWEGTHGSLINATTGGSTGSCGIGAGGRAEHGLEVSPGGEC